MLDAARELSATGPVCDACLGRPFADRSHGLTNAERGRALRVAVAMADDVPFEVPAEECWVCEGLCAAFDDWADRVVAALEGLRFETYQVGCRVPPLYEENERLLREEAGLDPDAGEALKSELNREVGKRVGERTGTTVDFERPDVLALLNLERGDVDVQVNPAFVYGRYRKLARGIPQTEWPCNDCGGTGKQMGSDGAPEPCPGCDGTGYRYDESVEGFVAPHVREAMDGADAVFHGAGREDVDAKMLGTGRPFVVEVKRPRDRFPDVAALEATINGATEKVAVTGLRLATHEMVERVKELDADKTYRAEVTFDAPVAAADLRAAADELSGTTIEQRTPHRVSHRRADKVRERRVYEVRTERVDDTHATVEVRAAGGTYVKELVSGDEGRTDPSLAGLLGVGAEVTALDVVAVEGVDEPFEAEAYVRDAPDEERATGDGAAPSSE
ncbi:MAG: tRNA pseudouridine(54/55) synthase Pus10 [Halobacteriaceae archaeon]